MTPPFRPDCLSELAPSSLLPALVRARSVLAQEIGETCVQQPATARIIDGKSIAAQIRSEIRTHVDELKRDHGTTPGLAVVLVGNRTDSSTYVRMKKRAADEVGFYSVDRSFPESVTEEELLACVRDLNSDPKVSSVASAASCVWSSIP